jgi:hypothetical protein
MNRQRPRAAYNKYEEYRKAEDSRDNLNKYLEDSGFEPGDIKRISNNSKKNFLLHLYQSLKGDVSVSDQQRRLVSKGIRYIDYPREEKNPMLISCKYFKDYVIYPTNVYGYLAFSGNGSLVAIAGRFADNLTEEEKSRTHSEHLFVDLGNNNTLCKLLLTCPPFNLLYLSAYSPDIPENPETPEEMDHLILEDLKARS